jgi:hypothetical protein
LRSIIKIEETAVILYYLRGKFYVINILNTINIDNNTDEIDIINADDATDQNDSTIINTINAINHIFHLPQVKPPNRRPLLQRGGASAELKAC